MIIIRPSLLLIAATLTLSVQASWFSGNSNDDDTHPAYTKWTKQELESWLDIHGIPYATKTQGAAPMTQESLRALVADNWNSFSTWTQFQYDSAQKAFSDVRETSFDKWDESKLRQFLLERGVVAPKGPREKLVLMAKAQWRDYQDAARTLTAAGAGATRDAKNMGAKVTEKMGEAGAEASRTLESVADQATSVVAHAGDEAGKMFDEGKHYVYSTWDEGMMRAWLVERGLLKSKEQKKKEEMLRMMHEAWGRVADPVWEAWSASYMHNWLVGRGIIKSDFEKKRDDLTNLMNSYYYSAKDTAWSNWTDSELRQWLIDHGVMKSDAQASRGKMIKMVEDNYLHARDTFWHAWTDNALRNWLTENGYLRTDAQVKRDQLVSLADEKWKEDRARIQSYLTWPDARLRAYLREQGVEEKYLPGDRPGLLQETRIRWVMTQNRAETLFQKIKELVNSGMYKAEDALLRLVHMLGAGWEEAKEKTSETFDEVRSRGSHEYHEAKRHGEEGWTEAKHRAGDDAEWVKREGEAKTAKLKGEL